MTLPPNPASGQPLRREMFQTYFALPDWQDGEALQQQGDVVSCQYFDQKHMLDGKVRDVVEVFRVKIIVEENAFAASCTCRRDRKKRTCKHMAALLLHWMTPPPAPAQPRASLLTPADERHLERIASDWTLHRSLHEAHRIKLQMLYQRCPDAVEQFLKRGSWGALWREVQEMVAPTPVPEPAEPEAEVLELGTLTLSAPRKPSILHTQGQAQRPAEPLPVPVSRQQLVFALELGKTAPQSTFPRLVPLVATVNRGALKDLKVYVPHKIPYLPTVWEKDMLQKVSDSRAQHRLRHTELTDDLLQELLSEKRLYLNESWHHPLQEAAPRIGEARWETDEAGKQHPVFSTRPTARIMVLNTVWYIDTMALKMGQVETEVLPHQLTFFMTMHAVSPEQVPKARQALRNVSGSHLPLPTEVPFDEQQGVLVPRLRVAAQDWVIAGLQAPVPTVSLSLTYLDQRVPGPFVQGRKRPLPSLRFSTEQGLLVVHRNNEAEQQVMKTMTTLGFHLLKNSNQDTLEYRFGPPGQFVPEHLWMHLLKKVFPDLKDQGWEVVLDASFPYRVVQPSLDASIQEEEGWFTLDLGVQVDGENVSLLPLLVNWMQNHQEELQMLLEQDGEQIEYLAVGHHTFVQVEMHRLRSILKLLMEFYSPRQQDFRLPRMAAGLLEDLQDHPQIRWQGGQAVLELAQNLGKMHARKRPKLPASLNATLRRYQHEGVGWLQMLRKTGCNGILADDMGLGKTLQTLTHLLIEKEGKRLKKPALIVAPTSVMPNWISEAAKFTPSLKTLLLHGPSRHKHFDQIPEADVVFTSYALLKRDIEVLSAHKYHMVILDEAQYIKNHHSQSSQALKELSSKHRLCLTGTPMENHLGELWSLFQFLMPGLLPREADFRTMFRQPIEQENDRSRQLRLARMVKPLMLRRTKQQVAPELPEKTEITVQLDLEGGQRDVYETLRVAMQERLKEEIEDRGLARSQIHVLDALLKLRQACCDPRLLSMEEAKKIKTSVKLQWLTETLPEMLEEGRTVLIFSQFTTLLDLLGEALKDLNIEYALLTGSTTDRQAQVQRFQSGEVKVFLVSLKAGGVGLNLTAADTVIHYDPWWNPAAENQATDRAYRIGQDKPVFVYKLVTTGTIEEKILVLQRHKAALASGILEGTLGEGLRITEEDLQGLLG
ncbi:DEAD/DEAH box helicase [Deinococcus roseus]|uniref:Helicase n=1 Tax=Deinococcus roseus TaxID=392414 RepID=A0ABQ2D5V9_9DEIO|nr:DEAD/DEAH box helicase [Deinococcus roseus]GGJ47303.1 hypothetical protein GCM10008938_36680 [Deinococcus roseus]